MPITMEDLPALNDLLVDIATMWWFIGIQLCLTPGALDNIAHLCTKADECLVRMLSTWLDVYGNKATVSKLIAALQSKAVRQLSIAEEVKEYFHTKRGLFLINIL